MTTKIRPRSIAVLVAIAGLLGFVAVAAPSSGAAAPTVVRLNLGTDGRYFEFGTTRQNLTAAKNTCVISSAEPLINLSSTGSQSDPGLGPDSIGVRQSASSGNGTPCTQVESVETLSLSPGSSMTGKLFKGVRLDLEMTGNAVVQLTFSGGATTSPDTYLLQTGNSIDPSQAAEWTPSEKLPPYFVSSGPGDQVDACAAPNSSGPNSGSNDNCQWTVFPLKTFSTITMTTTIGTVSLEGGGDFPSNQDRDSLFYLANSGPTAVNDSYSTNEDTTLTGSVTGNDTDPDGDTLTGATVVSGPTHGTLTLASNGSFTYLPATDYFGTDSFTYTVSDGVVTSNSATASITVAPVNDRPVAQSSNVSTPEETTTTVTVATDVDDDALTTTCTSSGGGTISDNGDGTVDYTPPLDFNGTIVLTCTSEDGAGATTSSSATINVGVTGVNDAPVGVDDEAEMLANAASVDIAVLDNDTDIDSSDLGVTDIANVTPAGASAVANPDGTVTYTPPVSNPSQDFTTPGSFTYKAIDGGGLKSAVTTVTIHPIICSEDQVTDTDGDVTGTFTRLTDPLECKQFSLVASSTDDTILFQPSGAGVVTYRGVVSFGPEPPPAPGTTGELALRLRYDPTGGEDFQPMQWCLNPQFDGTKTVTSATLPAGETWCVASAYTRGQSAGGLLLIDWQVYGIADPNITRR
jgi:VCBS repeat-containing protein